MRSAPRASIQSVVQSCYSAAGGIENVSADLGLAKSTLSEATELPTSEKRRGGLGLNHADTLARMHPGVARVLAEHFATLAGGTFHPLPAGVIDTLLSHVAVAARESGEAIHAGMMVAQDPTPRAIEEAIRETDEAQAAFADKRSALVHLRGRT